MDFLFYVPIPLLLIITVSAALGSGTINRYYSKNVVGGIGGFYFFLLITSAVSVFSIAVICGFDMYISSYTAVIGVVFGIVTALSSVCTLYAIEIGPWSYTTVITSFSMIIPSLAGVVFWNESIDALTVAGMILVVCSVVLSVQTGQGRKRSVRLNAAAASEIATASDSISVSEFATGPENSECGVAGNGTAEICKSTACNKHTTRNWISAVTLAALATGAIGVIQKVHRLSDHGNEFMSMLFIAFSVQAAVYVIALTVFTAKNGRAAALSAQPKNSRAALLLLLFICLAGLCGMINHVVNLYLVGVMDGAVFFPLVNGSGLVLVTLLSIFVYKERLSVMQWIGLGIGIAAVIMLCV